MKYKLITILAVIMSLPAIANGQNYLVGIKDAQILVFNKWPKKKLNIVLCLNNTESILGKDVPSVSRRDSPANEKEVSRCFIEPLLTPYFLIIVLP